MLDPKIYTLLKLEELGSYTRPAEGAQLGTDRLFYFRRNWH